MVLRALSLIFLIAILLSCSEEQPLNNSDAEIIIGEELYNNNCAVCHGLDGKLGAGGASDLTISELTKEATKDVVEKGRGGMPPQNHIFSSKNEIDEVVDFVMTMK